MKRNWYAVYTKVNCEKKVAALLSKKEIKTYYPLNRIVTFGAGRDKEIYQPLIPTIVFVYITQSQMPVIKDINGVINFVYWLGKPAEINNDEIVNMQFFTAEYTNVKVEKTIVNPGKPGIDYSEPVIDNEASGNKTLATTAIKLMLPSLGYMMVAEIEKPHVKVVNYSFERSNRVS